MKSILFSKMSCVSPELLYEVKKLTKGIKKLVIFPWTFSTEANLKETELDFFTQGGKHFEKYINQMHFLDINCEMLSINPYKTNRDLIAKSLNDCDAIFIPGGNPEMFMTLAIRNNAVDLFKNFKGLIIGESAGSAVQFELYGLPKELNFYECNSFYNGFGAINQNISINVHTEDTENFQKNLQILSSFKNLKIYTIYDESYIIYDRKNNDLQPFGKSFIIKPNKT